MVTIRETTEAELGHVKALWADGDVMKFVGFPDGLQQTEQEMNNWYAWLCAIRPLANHYSVFEDDVYCGEAFYRIDEAHGSSAALDIKLFRFARGRGIARQALSHAMEEAFRRGAERVWVDPNPENEKALALYDRLGFVCKPMPEYLAGDGDTVSVYMELDREGFLRNQQRGACAGA